MLPQPQLLPAATSGEGFGEAGPPSASAGSPAAHWPMPGRVEFIGVVLRYAGQSAPALNGLDVDVPGGSKIGICGRTGKLPVNFFCALTRMAGTGAASAPPHCLLYIACSCGSADGTWTSLHHSYCYARTQCSLADEHADLNDFKRSCSMFSCGCHPHQ